MKNRKSTTGFPTSYRWSAYVTPKSPKPIFRFFGIKFNFNRILLQSFIVWKTSSDKVVEQSISYEITEKYRTQSVSFHRKYWLKLTYRVVVSTCTALPNDVMSRIECGQLHSELFGRRRSTLQSHGLFALAKPLSVPTAKTHETLSQLSVCNVI